MTSHFCAFVGHAAARALGFERLKVRKRFDTTVLGTLYMLRMTRPACNQSLNFHHHCSNDQS